MKVFSTRLASLVHRVVWQPLAQLGHGRQTDLETCRPGTDRIPAVFRTRASAPVRGANLKALRRPLQVYVDAQDPRRARMAGSFSDICAQLDQMVRHQERADGLV